MINPKLHTVVVDDVIYGVMWLDFGTFFRFDVYQNDRRIGYRKLPRPIDQSYTTVRYLIRRMVGNYGISGRPFAPKEESRNGNR